MFMALWVGILSYMMLDMYPKSSNALPAGKYKTSIHPSVHEVMHTLCTM